MNFELKPEQSFVIKFVDIGAQSCLYTSKTFSMDFKNNIEILYLSNRAKMSKFISEQNKILKKQYKAKKYKDGSTFWGFINLKNVKEGFGKLLMDDGEVYYG